jgi:multidrug efflux pump subunit AcrA (membrane-fusion protein)
MYEKKSLVNLADTNLQTGRFKKWIITFAIFLVFMWLCTIISKSIYVSGLPVVQTGSPEKKYVEHIVEEEGITVEGGKQAVTVLEGLRIENIFVQRGDRIEEGMPLFQVDTEDLQEIIREKETAITKLNYQISDLQANQALQEQKRQLEEKRAKEDYTSADNKTGTAVERAEEDKNRADGSLQSHLNNPASVTSNEDRQKAWDAYNAWLNKEYELLDKITAQERIVTDMEAAEGTKTEEEKAALEDAKTQLNNLRDELIVHERNKAAEPNFSGEDSAYENWKNQTKSLQEILDDAEDAREDAYVDRSSTLTQEERGVEDALLPGQSDSTLSIYQMELAALQEDIDEYEQIMKQGGTITAQTGGFITDIPIIVGGRTPDTAALLFTDDTVPCRFKVTLGKEQKKYVNMGDKVNVKLGGKASLEVTVDYLEESNVSPGSYDVFMNLPEKEASPGISGTMSVSVQGESHELCVPVEALYKEEERYYVFEVKEREGILGVELYAEKVSVKVTDQNDRFAALEEGTINKDSKVIVSAEEEIKRGEIVKY